MTKVDHQYEVFPFFYHWMKENWELQEIGEEMGNGICRVPMMLKKLWKLIKVIEMHLHLNNYIYMHW